MATSEVASRSALGADNTSNVGTTTTTQKWKKVYLISYVVALLVDPLFFYIPIINQDMKCIGLDQNLKIATLLLRSAVDLPCIVHIISQILAATSKDPRRCERVKLIEHVLEMAEPISWRYWLIDILAILPIPHVVILILLTRTRGSKSLNARNFLNSLVIFQYVPRAFRVYRSYEEANKPPDNWNGYILCLKVYKFILPCHVSGAIWYYFSIQREMDCWQYACGSVNKCEAIQFGCAGNTFKIVTFLNVLCPINIPNSTIFDFGIFLDALQSDIMGSTDFPQKLLHCFWWGLRSLSSLGQNLQTSNYAWEDIFALCISITGILLFFIYLNEIVQAYRTHHPRATAQAQAQETQDLEAQAHEAEAHAHAEAPAHEAEAEAEAVAPAEAPAPAQEAQAHEAEAHAHAEAPAHEAPAEAKAPAPTQETKLRRRQPQKRENKTAPPPRQQSSSQAQNRRNKTAPPPPPSPPPSPLRRSSP